MKRKLSIFVLSLISVMGVQKAVAWSTFEHGAIAYVAEQHLTPEAKAKCRYYLKHTLPYYSVWMDFWRGVDMYKSINNPHTITESAEGTLDWSVGKLPGGVMAHLKNALDELGDGKYKSLPDSIVRQRIINMAHYIPDMHCPVHIKLHGYPVGSRKIYRNGKEVSFHGYWDGLSGKVRKGWTYERYTKEVDKATPEQVAQWTQGTLDDWGNDCIMYAHQANEITPNGTDLAEFTKEQKDAALALSDLTALMGAYRLAYVLNTIFKE